MIRPAAALALTLALGACEQSEPPKESAKMKMYADTVLLKDVALAGSELEQRLRASIQAQDGLIIVHDPIMKDLESYVLPPSSSWIISCGFGLSVGIGIGNSENDIQLQLTEATIDQKDCAVLGPRLGKRLKAILQGNDPAPP
jgi:hypothetical protein